MRLAFTLGPEDYDAFHQDYYRTAPDGRRTMRVGRWGLPAVVVVLVLGQIALAGYDPIWTPLLFGYAASWAAVFPRLVGWVTARRNRRWARRDAGTAAFAPQNLEFTADGIGIEAAGGRSRLPWAAVQRVSQGPQHVFLYLDSRRALVVPLRACADSGTQALLLEDCLKRHAAAAAGNR